MRFLRNLSFALLALLAVAGCEHDTATAPAVSEANSPHAVAPEVIADQLVRLAGWEIDADAAASLDLPEAAGRAASVIADFTREDLGNGIAHYFAEVRFGPGPYDLVGLHRVVKERRPGVPGRKLAHLFLLHGDAKDFTGMFLPGTRGANTPADFGLAVYLAESGVDVWGMDQGWVFIPESETDQSAGIGWGLQRSAHDLRLAVGVARVGRLLTGSGGAPLNVLGYSSGVPTIYAAANDEAVLAPYERQIGGLVAADFFPRTESPGWIETFGADLQFQQSLLDAGEYLQRIPFDILEQVYTSDPDGDSPFAPGFTNAQFFWYFMTGQVFGAPTFHYFGGNDVDGDGFADEFRFANEAWVLDFLAAGIKYQPTQFFRDYDAMVCQCEDVPWDDNFGLIDLPILSYTARGGVTTDGVDPAALTASSDVTTVELSPDPGVAITSDFGHIDLFLTPVARDFAWPQLLDWILDHTPRAGHGRGVAELFRN